LYTGGKIGQQIKEDAMDDYRTLVFEEKNGVAWIRLNRPKEFNALNMAMAEELGKVATHCATEDRVRCVVLTGTGKAFCAGGDVKDMYLSLQESSRADLFLRELAMRLHIFVADIARMPKPVIAAVNGTAAGAGMSMSLACDLSVAVEEAKFVLAYTNIGLVPDGSSTYFLTRVLGYKKAMELVYLNEPINADEALRLGIVNKIYPSDSFEEGVSSVAAKLAKGPTKAYGRAKEIVRLGLLESLESQMENERQGIAVSALGGEFREGVTAFVEKRKPDFLTIK
jgi:2-(1,2-epoxy-1,2-dihydrophenyl)acetyl-CoA isomerase